MNWIKKNPFVSALAGASFFICVLLVFFASKGGSKYEAAKDSFDDAFREVSKFERLKLYPKADTRDAKKKVLDDYRKSIGELRQEFDRYRVDEIVNISTQVFTSNLKATANDVVSAFEASKAKLPDDFFMGFNSYQNQLARTEATGLLDYQLNGVKHVLLDLAEARPKKLISIYRESIPEEEGGKYTPAKAEVARKFGFEIAFKGSEESARKFISSLAEVEPYYFIVRSIRIKNERDVPPRVSDAKFEKPKPVVDPGAAFGDGFFDEAVVVPAEDTTAPVTENEDVVPAEKAPVEEVVMADSTKILAQVLGSEELLVFVRFDLMLFHKVKELPTP